ncbi:MAG TPA: hypothetical protein VGR21_00355 [Cryptosporangiaceae bacterium]|nr:hypothetical protein [Cryptosporangiaceae bacterium]
MTHRRGSDPDPRSPGDGELPDLPPEWGQVVVPDDLAELAAEVAAVQAELAASQQLNRMGRLVRTRPRNAARLTAPLVVLGLVLVTALTSLVILVLPTNSGPPTNRPALATPGVPAGQVGGLVPLVGLVEPEGRWVRLRDLRPAVLLLTPSGCARCPGVGVALMDAARDSGVTVALVTDTDQPDPLPPNAARNRAVTLADPGGGLFKAVTNRSATGPTVVLVRADGVITRIVPDVADPAALRGELATLSVT